MNKIIYGVVGITGLVLASVTNPVPVWYSRTQICDGGYCGTTAPTATTDPTGSTTGKLITNGKGYKVWVCPSANCLLSGDGGVRVYNWSYNPGHPGRWEFNSQLDELMSSAVTEGPTTYCVSFPDHVSASSGTSVVEIVSNGITIADAGAGTCSVSYGIDGAQ